MTYPPPVVHSGYGRAALACLVWPATSLALILALLGPPPSAGAFGLVAGSLTVHALLAALPVWLIVRHRAWARWQVLLLALGCFLVVRTALSAIG
ncbi:MAG: hypothetical protein J0I49_26640 [Pseudonocardia sp.]|uniref:hypothetical protein n=1 Tax=Pseudonocardia sp. TaxID=60912 RepID=UPI001AC6AFB3|nr:hypothetical protein [Pseudonocardia sp.]MBN9101647.1 hypothetical protein [Pseudonocardia sp.]